MLYCKSIIGHSHYLKILFIEKNVLCFRVLDFKIDNLVDYKSNETDKYGVKWFVSAFSYVSENDGEEYLGIYLHAEHQFECK